MDHKQIRIASIIVGVVISIVILVLGFGLMQNVFTKAEDSAPRDVVVGEVTANTAKVTWATGQANQGVIEYGTSPTALNFFAPESQQSTTHTVDLTLLSPNTTYYFQIRIGEKKYDNGGVPWTFTTQATDKTAPTTAVSPTSAIVPTTAPTSSASVNSATPTPISSVEVPAGGSGTCTETVCEKIQQQIGKGCTAADYVKCIKNPTPTP